MFPELRKTAFQLNQPAITATSDSPAFVPDTLLGVVEVLFNVTAVAGTTPTLTVQPMVSSDGGTTWFNAGPASASITAASQTRLSITGVLAGQMKLHYVAGGTTPSFTVTATVITA